MIERYRIWFEHERVSNARMLGMIASVPESARDSAKYRRALTLAAHLCACRENWLESIVDGTHGSSEWWEETVDAAALAQRFLAMEAKWTDYLANLDDATLNGDFDFDVPGYGRCRLPIEGQIAQLVGHAHYHRGQIALLVDELGGEAVDTDFVYWILETNPRYGKIADA